MREIKFVVWDKKNKRMWSEVTDIYWRDGKIASIRGLTHYNDTDNQPIGLHEDYGDIEENLILLQYTGLKDTNDLEEIYEGNIVKLIHSINGNFVDDVIKMFSVIHQTCGFVLKPVNKNALYTVSLNTNEYTTVEIIGSIYENPELLK